MLQTIICGAVLTVLMVTILVVVSKIEHEYSLNGFVRWKEDGVLTVEDTTGNLWDYEIDEVTEELKEKDNVMIKFHDNGSDSNRRDDVILEIQKI